MENLDVINLYEDSNREKSQKFIKQTESVLKVRADFMNITRDIEWIDVVEEVLPHIEAIFRSPNRFIENEGEIVKIEQTRKVSVETIKHLSKNTNFIQTVDEDTGDVIPSKLLNVRKEESYNTYENRLIYTLIQNLKLFIHKRKTAIIENLALTSSAKNKKDKSFEYNGNSKFKDEKIDINVYINSKLDDNKNDFKDDSDELLIKIQEIEKNITGIESMDIYKIIDKANILLVKEPIRKTNVVLKNVHFQYAMKLWSYLKDNFDDKSETKEVHIDYEDNGNLKKMMDEAFLLQYLVLKTLDEDKSEKQDTQKEIKALVLEQMIDKMLDIDMEMTEQQLQQLVAEKYEVIKYKKMAILQDIQKIFKSHIEKYEEKLEEKGS